MARSKLAEVKTRVPVFFRSFIVLVFFAFARIVAAAPATTADDSVDRTTPRRTFEGFRSAASDGDYERASKYLDLHGLSRAKAASEGADLARDFSYVIERQLAIDEGTIPDTADAGDTSGMVTIATIVVEDDTVPIKLAHVKSANGNSRWLIAKSTVLQIPELDAAFGPKPWEEKMPKFLRAPHVLGNAPWQWAGLLVALMIALLLGRIGARVMVAVGRRLVARFRNSHRKSITAASNDEIVLPARSPLRSIVAVVVFRGLSGLLVLTVDVDSFLSHATSMLLTFSIAWLLIRLLRVAAAFVEDATLHGNASEQDTRGLRTQLALLHRIASIVVGAFALIAILLQFAVVRSFGASLLASAGVAGIVLGLAAQKSLGAIIAGVQLSLAQPMRLGDTVVVDGQNGQIEELHLTYVVVKLWDERRLIVPIGKFLDQSFENWTKLGTNLRGEVLVFVDYLAPIEKIRAELKAACSSSKQWDERVCSLQVVDANERGMTLRAVVSAKGTDDLFELRCLVRERLLAFTAQLDNGKFLVRARAATVSAS